MTQEDRTGSGPSTKTYAYDAWGRRVGMTNTPQGAQEERFLYAYDVHGSVSLLVNEEGADAGRDKASYGYTPYGESDDPLTKGDVSKDDPLNPYRYSARRFDSGSGPSTWGPGGSAPTPCGSSSKTCCSRH